MSTALDETAALGVYANDAKGELSLVHAYIDGDYGLEDVAECFRLGGLSSEDSGPTALVLSFKEVKQLKTLADANSFDYEPGFIEMCLDMHRFAMSETQEQFCFLGNF